jgi:hypothetical protein
MQGLPDGTCCHDRIWSVRIVIVVLDDIAVLQAVEDNVVYLG